MEEQYWGYLSCVPRDVDGDGDLDIIISDCLGKVRWIENTGTRQKPVLSKNVRNFYYGNQPLVTPWRNRPGVADWNGDGRLDFIVLDDRSDLVMYSQSAHNPEVLENKRKLRKSRRLGFPYRTPDPPRRSGTFQYGRRRLERRRSFRPDNRRAAQLPGRRKHDYRHKCRHERRSRIRIRL